MLRDAVSKVWNSTLARNAGWMFMGQGMAVVVQALYFVVIARLLGSTQYGIYAGAAALVSIVSQYSSLGSGVIFLRYVSADHNKFSAYWGNVLLSTLGMGTLLVLLLRLTGHWLINKESASILTVVAIGDCICGRLAECTGQIFQAYEKLKITAILSLLTNTFRLLLAVGMSITLHNATATQWSYAALAVSIFAVLIATGTVTFRFGKPEFVPWLLRKNVAEGFGYAVSSSTTSIYNDIDKTMLAHYGMNQANGIYTMAYRLIDMSTLPMRSIHAAAMPRFFRMGFDGVEPTVRYARKILSKTAILGILAAVGLLVGAPVIPHIIGKSFARSISTLRWLCLLPLFRCFHLSAGDAIAGAGYQRFRTAGQFVAAGFNFAINLYLIPHYSWKGAAWSSLMTDGGLGVLNWAILLYLRNRDKKPAPVSEVAA
jgi:O-antigen/teichoic acid export membrane protein